MLSSVDHYTLLLRAVAQLDRASYEARGAIYDRALGVLIKRLQTADPPYSEADIDRELLAFREAVRRIEFGDLDERDRLAQQAIADRAVRAGGGRDLQQDFDRALHQGVRPSPLQGARRAADPALAVDEPHAVHPPPRPGDDDLPPLAPRRSRVFGRLAGRAALAALLLAVGIAGYAYRIGQLDLSAWSGLLALLAGSENGATTQASEPAIYYEQPDRGSPWRELAGNARWRTDPEGGADGSRKDTLVLMLEVQVPERGLALIMSMRRDASGDATLTHLIDLKFADAQGAPMSGVTAVGNVVMKQADGGGSSALAGRSIKVAPGVFLFGLSGEGQDARRNLEALRTLPRLDIPFAYANGATGIISVNKGASGDRAFAAALASWAR